MIKTEKTNPTTEVLSVNIYQDILKKLEAGEAVALETGIRGESGSIAENFSRRLTAVVPREDLKGAWSPR